MENQKKLKILIALDYDLSAKKVAEAGCKFATMLNADVVLLHVISDPLVYSAIEYSPMTDFSGSIHALPLDSDQSLEKASLRFLDAFKQRYASENSEVVVCDGDFSAGILKTAKNRHVDFIAIGSHSHNWIERAILGSVTEQVLRDAKVPVIVIPVKQK